MLDPSQETAVKVGRVVAVMRKEKRLSQETLAEKADCHRNNVGLIERGERTTSIYMLHTIAKALDSTASEILKKAGY